MHNYTRILYNPVYLHNIILAYIIFNTLLWPWVHVLDIIAISIILKKKKKVIINK